MSKICLLLIHSQRSILMEMAKIHTGLYGGKSFFKGVRDSKYTERSVYCDHCDSCSLYKEGMCLRVVSGFAGTACPYGRSEVREGYTPKAKKSAEWCRKVKEDSVYGKLKHPVNLYAALVGDYVWLDLVYVDIFERTEEKRTSSWQKLGWQVEEKTFTGSCFVPKAALSTELLAKALTFKPHAFMGGVIETYGKDIVPQVVTELKKILPDLMNDVFSLEPSLDTEDNYIGRWAYVKTMAAGSILVGDGEYTLIKEGSRIILKGENSQLRFGSVVRQKVEFDVPDDMVYKIDNNAQVDNNTRFR